MSRATYARALRDKYGIPARELAEAAGVSQQFVSDLELGRYGGRYEYAHTCADMLREAFEKIIEQRAERARRLSEDLASNADRLLELMEDKDEL